ncbi:DedA family protein [Lysobacter humi (ex Lee et al. 2017)]
MDDWITRMLDAGGYAGLALLMFVENVFPPIPSELVMPLAGFMVSQGRFTLWGAALAGTLGSVLGALGFYALGRWVGGERIRGFARRHGRWLTLSPRDIDRAERWFERHGVWVVLLGRLVPGVRSLISIPAGIHRMPLPRFVVATAVGSFAWSAGLAWLGFRLGENFVQIGHHVGTISKVVLGAMLAIYAWRVLRFDARHAR